MQLGLVSCKEGYGCQRCGSHEDANILTNLIHDLRCWGVKTTLYNAWVRLSEPAWFREEQG